MDITLKDDIFVVLQKKDGSDWISCYMWQIENEKIHNLIQDIGTYDSSVNTIRVVIHNKNFGSLKHLLYSEIHGYNSGNMERAEKSIIADYFFSARLGSFIYGLSNIQRFIGFYWQNRDSSLIFGEVQNNLSNTSHLCPKNVGCLSSNMERSYYTRYDVLLGFHNRNKCIFSFEFDHT
jgi:hypothetical protein